MRFVRVDEIREAGTGETSNFRCRGNASPRGRNTVNWNVRGRRAASELRIAHGDESRRVTARAQSLQQQQRLMLPAAIVAA